MNILFLTIAYISDVQEKGIYTDLIRKFRNEGHNVYIVTPFERRLKKSTSLIKQCGVNILGVKMLNIQKTNFIEKGVSTLLIEYLYSFTIKKYLTDIRFDLILYSTPPITFTSTIRKLKKKYSAKTYLLLKDIFPQNAVDLQLFSKRSLWYKVFRQKEKKLYEISDHIGCMSPANIEFLQKNNLEIDIKKLELNPNSIELTDENQPIDRNKIRVKYGLPLNIPILLYGGNLGKPQGVDFLIEVLKQHERTDCFFLIVGSGTEFEKINKLFQTYHFNNAQLMKGIPKKEYGELIKSCDVGLIFLDHRFTTPNYPSRLLSYLEHKKPIIAATDKSTDIGKIAEANNYGFWCESNDVDEFNRCITKMISDEKNMVKMGVNGYQYLQRNYTVEDTYRTIVKHK